MYVQTTTRAHLAQVWTSSGPKFKWSGSNWLRWYLIQDIWPVHSVSTPKGIDYWDSTNIDRTILKSTSLCALVTLLCCGVSRTIKLWLTHFTLDTPSNFLKGTLSHSRERNLILQSSCFSTKFIKISEATYCLQFMGDQLDKSIFILITIKCNEITCLMSRSNTSRNMDIWID